MLAVAGCLLLAFLLTSCQSPDPAPQTTATTDVTATPAATPSAQPPAVQVVEATRVVTHEVVVTATPAPLVACAPVDAQAADEFVIGVLGPFSQNAAWPRALAMQAGASLALEDINQAGGIAQTPVRAVMADTTGDPQLAARLAESLVTRDCASALIGGFTTAEAAAIKEVSAAYGVPFLIVDAAADELTSDQPATVFRVAPTASMIAQMPAQWLATVGDFNNDGVEQVLLIAENSVSGDASLQQANQVLPPAGIAYDVLRVDAPSADYSPLIARVVARDQTADVIMLYMTGDASLDLLRQLLDAGVGPRNGSLVVVGRAALDGAQFWERVPNGEFTVISRRGPWYTSVTSAGQSFVERYAVYSPHWPDTAAFAAYDAIRLVADAAERAATISPPDLVAALETADITLAAGYYHFPFNSSNPPAREGKPDYLWHQWPDPPLLYMQYREPQQDPATLDILWPPLYRTVDMAVLQP